MLILESRAGYGWSVRVTLPREIWSLFHLGLCWTSVNSQPCIHTFPLWKEWVYYCCQPAPIPYPHLTLFIYLFIDSISPFLIFCFSNKLKISSCVVRFNSLPLKEAKSKERIKLKKEKKNMYLYINFGKSFIFILFYFDSWNFNLQYQRSCF